MFELVAYPQQWLGTGPLFTGFTVLVCVDIFVFTYTTMIICSNCLHRIVVSILALCLQVNNGQCHFDLWVRRDGTQWCVAQLIGDIAAQYTLAYHKSV